MPSSARAYASSASASAEIASSTCRRQCPTRASPASFNAQSDASFRAKLDASLEVKLHAALAAALAGSAVRRDSAGAGCWNPVS
eukprot:3364730-Pleurochrysis_carterae.AAC.5